MKRRSFSLEDEFEFYLDSVKLDRSTLTVGQFRELKRSFAAGMSQTAVFLLSSDVTQLDPNICRVIQELKYFWEGEQIAHQLKF